MERSLRTNYTAPWVLEIRKKWIYDGWLLLAEIEEKVSAPAAPAKLAAGYHWGRDLSGSLEGAGGVGGLVLLEDWRTGTAQRHFYTYDGNGNVMGLIDLTDIGDPRVSAEYEYGPFGEALRVSGPLGQSNPFRFSSKFADYLSGLVYYGYRYYQPATGRWLSRDPIGIRGGINLYGMCRNDAVNAWDPRGLEDFKDGTTKVTKFEKMEKEPWMMFGDSAGAGPRHGVVTGSTIELPADFVKEWITRYGPTSVVYRFGVDVVIDAAFNDANVAKGYYWWQEVDINGAGFKNDGGKKRYANQSLRETVLTLQDQPALNAKLKPIGASPGNRDGTPTLIQEFDPKSFDPSTLPKNSTWKFKTHLVCPNDKVQGTWTWGLSVKVEDGKVTLDATKPVWQKE